MQNNFKFHIRFHSPNNICDPIIYQLPLQVQIFSMQTRNTKHSVIIQKMLDRIQQDLEEEQRKIIQYQQRFEARKRRRIEILSQLPPYERQASEEGVDAVKDENGRTMWYTSQTSSDLPLCPNVTKLPEFVLEVNPLNATPPRLYNPFASFQMQTNNCC